MSDSDALTIARWCWPGRTWREGRYGVDDIGIETADGFRFKDDPKSLLVTRPEDVHAAERVLIERGHAEAYGLALHALVVCEQPWDGKRGIIPDITANEIAQLATAPLDARVRAMVAVIRAQGRA